MNRQEKATVVDTLRQDFKNSQAAFLIGYQGMTVAQVQKLRENLRKYNGEFKVAKARLMKRAVEGLEGPSALTPYFKNQVGLVFAPKESPAIAKVLYDFSKDNAKLQLVIGCLDAKLLDNNLIVRIASLPSREILLAQVCGTINAPLASLVRVLDQIAKKMESGV
jgi:large subunit ribosomal protein L10